MAQFWPPRPPRILTGTISGVNTNAYVTATFPSGFFTSPPMVYLSSSDGTGTGVVNLWTGTTTKDSVEIAGNSPIVRWLAIQL